MRTLGALRSAIRTPWLGLLAMLFALSTHAATNYGAVELLRDTWGIPHVFADTDEGAMYGLGYATASERGFQMTYSLRIIQGRLAEVISDRQKSGRKETALDNDRKMRTFGWARAAARTASNLDRPTLQLLQAYCDGVNASFAAQTKSGTLHPLFKDLAVKPEPWTPADCLLSWWHVAQFFATDGTRDLLVWRNRNDPQGRGVPPSPTALWADDAAAVVQREDVPDDWVRRVEEFKARHFPSAKTNPGASETPKFSHAWVVGGKKTGTGSAVLVSDPQTPVRDPSLWMEFHVKGKTFDARGVGMPGSPGLLLGFNRRVAWGLTALGADQADLFRLETSPDHPDQYRWNGEWRKMTVLKERILVKDGDAEELTIRETHLGPVVSAFAFRQAGDPEVALKRVPICQTNRDTIQGNFAMMRATNAAAFRAALADWHFPSANCVYGDADGHIGYAALGAMPIRSRSAGDQDGNLSLAGTVDDHDWRGFIPADLLPRSEDPARGFILSANHRPITSFYTLPMGTSTGSMGDTIRSWRLRERLSDKELLTPADVLDVHYDTVNPARRDIVRLALHIRKTQPAALSEDTQKALAVLEKWLADGASSDLKVPGAALATRISTFFRFIATPLAKTYGGGESGLARFLKHAIDKIQKDPAVSFGEEEQEFVDKVISDAWRSDTPNARDAGRNTASNASEPRRNPPSRDEGSRRDASSPAPGTRSPDRDTQAPTAVPATTFGWFNSLDGFGSLDPARDLTVRGITCFDGQTIHCQSGQSYTQWIPLHDVDSARTICPIGHSDRPDSPFRTSTRELWTSAKLHPAPLSREAVERITVQRMKL